MLDYVSGVFGCLVLLAHMAILGSQYVFAVLLFLEFSVNWAGVNTTVVVVFVLMRGALKKGSLCPGTS